MMISSEYELMPVNFDPRDLSFCDRENSAKNPPDSGIICSIVELFLIVLREIRPIWMPNGPN